MLAVNESSKVSQLLKAVGDPFRVRLVLALAEQEACVCHLERALGKRQAYISQHLAHLKRAGLISSRRKGKYVFYALKDSKIVGLIEQARSLLGFESSLSNKPINVRCTCPQCEKQKENEC